MDKDQVKGRAKEVSGKVKEVAGKVVGDKKLEAKGNIEKNVGKAQAAYGDVKSEVKKGI
ncbi:CsbD family protein [Fundidesulfovibrio putealis]|uniref:CsbD family protein n=1 Tax=Fundidesulfovibrio putealis TaxID=270496 RepID=UPI00040E33F5|nr:CsbD family protein [Fundidesulfovibrio putealis]